MKTVEILRQKRHRLARAHARDSCGDSRRVQSLQSGMDAFSDPWQPGRGKGENCQDREWRWLFNRAEQNKESLIFRGSGIKRQPGPPRKSGGRHFPRCPAQLLTCERRRRCHHCRQCPPASVTSITSTAGAPPCTHCVQSVQAVTRARCNQVQSLHSTSASQRRAAVVAVLNQSPVGSLISTVTLGCLIERIVGLKCVKYQHT